MQLRDMCLCGYVHARNLQVTGSFARSFCSRALSSCARRTTRRSLQRHLPILCKSPCPSCPLHKCTYELLRTPCGLSSAPGPAVSAPCRPHEPRPSRRRGASGSRPAPAAPRGQGLLSKGFVGIASGVAEGKEGEWWTVVGDSLGGLSDVLNKLVRQTDCSFLVHGVWRATRQLAHVEEGRLICRLLTGNEGASPARGPGPATPSVAKVLPTNYIE
jgi:hypothetical protein